MANLFWKREKKTQMLLERPFDTEEHSSGRSSSRRSC
jgi:hypothetical protein